jgi:hypothetical protein
VGPWCERKRTRREEKHKAMEEEEEYKFSRQLNLRPKLIVMVMI